MSNQLYWQLFPVQSFLKIKQNDLLVQLLKCEDLLLFCIIYDDK